MRDGAGPVLHAAGVYSFDSRRRREMWRTNVTGTETVLAAARRAGVGRIGYVSTFGALLPATGDLGPLYGTGRVTARQAGSAVELTEVA